MFRSSGVDLAVDLGTATTRVHVGGHGIAYNEPTVAAVSVDHEVVAAGSEAVELVGRSQKSLSLVRPLAGGTIADFDLAERILRYAIHRARPPRRRLRVTISAAVAVSDLERRAIALVAEAVGGRDVAVVEPAVAAARGVGLPIDETAPSMVGVLGAAVTEVAVLVESGVVASSRLRVGGDTVNAAIAAWLRTKHALLVGDRTAEQVKINIGTAWPTTDDASVDVRGRDLESGLPQTVTVTASEVRTAIAEPVAQIAQAVRATMDRCPPEVAADVAQRGLTLTGGGALLTGLAQRVRSETIMPVAVPDRPLESVVLGAAVVDRR